MGIAFKEKIMAEEKVENSYQEPANKVASQLDADVLLINARMERGLDDNLISLLLKRKLRKNVLLILVTPGGNPDVAYRISRFLQDYYEKFIAFISGYCKSAGTLCVLGATEIVMSDLGELGPLDVQLYKKDEIGELSSGLVAAEILDVLQTKAFEMFEDYLLQIEEHSEGQITFKTASEIASRITVGLLEPLYKQIDPIQVGEIARSMQIATSYGERLLVRGKNFTKETMKTLCETYPSHGFVIDRPEVQTLFKNVRVPSVEEDELRWALKGLGYLPNRKRIIQFLSDEVKPKGKGNEKPAERAKPSAEAKPRTNTKRNKKNT